MKFWTRFVWSICWTVILIAAEGFVVAAVRAGFYQAWLIPAVGFFIVVQYLMLKLMEKETKETV